jgi:hypothetical protein
LKVSPLTQCKGELSRHHCSLHGRAKILNNLFPSLPFFPSSFFPLFLLVSSSERRNFYQVAAENL